MSKLLINEPPLQVIPSLAVMIGLSEAMVLQQLHYWLPHAKTRHNGKQWIYKTVANWKAQDFPFWDEKTIRNIFKSLEKQNLVLVEKLSENKQRRVNYYTIDYKQLAMVEKKHARSLILSHSAIFTECNWQFLPNGFGNFYLIHSAIFTECNWQFLPNVKESKKENTKETNKDIFKKSLIDKNFKPQQTHIDKMNKYDIPVELMIESFIARSKDKGVTSLDWNEALTVWLNTHIMQNKLKPVNEYQSAFPDWNDRNPDYQPADQGYHPSHDTTPSNDFMYLGGVKKPPFAGMSLAETETLISSKMMQGESMLQAYNRVSLELGGQYVS